MDGVSRDLHLLEVEGDVVLLDITEGGHLAHGDAVAGAVVVQAAETAGVFAVGRGALGAVVPERGAVRHFAVAAGERQGGGAAGADHRFGEDEVEQVPDAGEAGADVPDAGLHGGPETDADVVP